MWKTSVLVKDPKRTPSMVCIKLPCQDMRIVERIYISFILKYDALLHIWPFDGDYYVRLSCNMFSELWEYEKIA